MTRPKDTRVSPAASFESIKIFSHLRRARRIADRKGSRSPGLGRTFADVHHSRQHTLEKDMKQQNRTNRSKTWIAVTAACLGIASAARATQYNWTGAAGS